MWNNYISIALFLWTEYAAGLAGSVPVTGRSLAIAPRNAAAVAGDTVELVCEVSPDAGVSRVIWVEFISKTGGEVITSDKEVLDGHPHAERYSIATGSSTQFNLKIHDVIPDDGGKYMCEDTVSSKKGVAELVLLRSEPICETTFSGSNGLVRVGQEHSITCSVDFTTYSIKPVMAWIVPWQSAYKIEDTIGEQSIRSKLIFTVTEEMNGRYVSCRTGFNALESAPANAATNAPQWNHFYNTTTLKVA